MYNYHAEIVWSINIVLLAVLALTCVIIFFSVSFKEHLWQKRRRALLNLKKNVYEMVLADKKTPDAICLPIISEITPQQFIDIETNRAIDATFFNEAEQKIFRSCYINPDRIDYLAGIVEKAKNKWEKVEAMLCLGYTRTEAAEKILKKLILSKDKDIAYFSMVSLGHIKTVGSARALLDFLKKEPTNGYKIISILEDFPEEITDDVVELINYHDPMVRLWALTLFSKFASETHIKKLEKLTHDESAEVRAAACDCLGNIQNTDASSALMKCLKDDSWLVKSHAIFALSKVMKEEAIPRIVGFINDASWSVVETVRDVMTRHIKASLPFIERFLAGEDEIPKKYSVIALQNSGYLAELLNEVVSGKAKDFEIRLLKGVVKSRIHSGLDAALSELQPDTRAKALEILMKMEEA